MALVDRKMRGCVVGAGPSGLFAAKYLADRGVAVTVYEKSQEPLGNYKLAIRKDVDFSKILANEKIRLETGKDHSKIDDQKCDFYVVATGAVPRRLKIKGSEFFSPAVDLISDRARQRELLKGKTIAVAGVGNVALDLIWHFAGICKEVTLFSTKGVDDATFDNHVLSELAKSRKELELRTNEFPVKRDTRKQARRTALFQRLFKGLEAEQDSSATNKTIVSFLFRTKLEEAKREKDKKVRMYYSDSSGLHSAVFDSAISSVGFVPNRVEITGDGAKKPVFYTGWCVDPHGNVGDAMMNSKECVGRIAKELGI